MGEFRIGRKFASHSYPEPPRGGPGPAGYARNFAIGPSGDTAISNTGTKVPWALIESGTSGVDIPITPRVTTRVLLVGMVAVENSSLGNVFVEIQAQVNGVTVTVPVAKSTVVAANESGHGFETVPFVMEVAAPVGVTTNIELLVTAQTNGALIMNTDSSTLEVREVPVATG